MRTLNELYVLLLDYYNDKPESNFICFTMREMFDYDIISLDEFTILDNHFQLQYPTKELHSEFINDSFYGMTKRAWWDNKDKKTRVSFLTKLIEITK